MSKVLTPEEANGFATVAYLAAGDALVHAMLFGACWLTVKGDPVAFFANRPGVDMHVPKEEWPQFPGSFQSVEVMQ